MRTFLLLIFVLGALSILAILGLIIYELVRKRYKYEIKKLLKIVVCLVIICSLAAIIDFSIESQENKSKLVQNEKPKTAEEERIEKVRSDQTIYAQLLESGKTYEQMNEEERKNAYYIITVWNDLEQSFKEKYQSQKDALEKDRAEFFAAQEVKIAAKQAEENKASYDTGITYEQLARTPNDFKNKKAKFSGKVIQVVEDEKENDLRLAVDGNYDNILYIGYDPNITSTRILENDYVTVRGISLGIYSYESTMGAKISIPSMWVEQIEIN
ncbi:hypothetical protein [Clostridium kluyveri]|uniref:hypothetical protein n=1 Tax=Clostridium kluyveri TaxID=1534 RepID=UPI0012EC0A7D|nr:hypothetical protein [Clostridium kluyveri]